MQRLRVDCHRHGCNARINTFCKQQHAVVKLVEKHRPTYNTHHSPATRQAVSRLHVEPRPHRPIRCYLLAGITVTDEQWLTDQQTVGLPVPEGVRGGCRSKASDLLRSFSWFVSETPSSLRFVRNNARTSLGPRLNCRAVPVMKHRVAVDSGC